MKEGLKAGTQQKISKGTRRHIERNNKIPSNWPEFLCDDENKLELFNLISERVVNEYFTGIVIITHGR